MSNGTAITVKKSVDLFHRLDLPCVIYTHAYFSDWIFQTCQLCQKKLLDVAGNKNVKRAEIASVLL